MWSFASNAFARSLGLKNEYPKPSQACSDDEVSSISNREEGLECPICWESFNIVENVPYVLWCGHTLCKNCVLGLQWAVVKFSNLPFQLPLFISCPWCHLLSFRLVYNGNVRFPRKNFFLLWMVESMNGDRVKSHSAFCGDHQPVWSTNSNLALGGQINRSNFRRAPPSHHPEESGSNREHDGLATNYLNVESLHSSLRKSLIFFLHFTAKFPLVIILILIVLYAIPAGAAVLALYILITVLFALPSFLLLYFAYPTLDWLVRAISVSLPKSSILQNSLSLREPNSTSLGGSLKGFCLQLKPRSKGRDLISLVVASASTNSSSSNGGRGLGPGPSLRTLLQTTIQTTELSDSQAGLIPVRSPLLRSGSSHHLAQVLKSTRLWVSLSIHSSPCQFFGIFRAKTLKDKDLSTPRADKIEPKVLSSPEVGIGPYVEVAFYHKHLRTLLITDAGCGFLISFRYSPCSVIPTIMDEERIELLVTPQRTKPDGGNLRRHSTGKKSTSNSGENILPHYLRASTGSCHDFCKYGRKHAFEAKTKHPMLKKNTATRAECQDPVKDATLARREKKLVVKLKPSSGSKTQLPDKSKIVKREISSPAKKVYVSATHSLLVAKETAVSAKHATALKPNAVAANQSSSPLNLSGGLSGRRSSDVKIGKNMGTSKIGGQKILLLPTASLSPKPSVNRVASFNTGKNPKIVPSLNNQNGIKNAEPKQPNDNKVREKTLYVVESKSENKSLGLAQNGTCSSSSSHTSSCPSISPSMSSQEEEEREESEFTLSEAIDYVSQHDETENENQIETLEGDYKRKPIRGATIHPEDKDYPPRKLNFRRGKVIDLKSEINGPRRLRFKQGRVLGDNQNDKGDSRRRSFRRRREVVDSDSNGTSEKVVLRHQDVQGKRDAQGLFNNVIEETASKLVETRKSKVKALVGAFETVISLQESKPSTN
ncbi:hypothetical protein HHK36_015420 [Tetracentron sinense]|uniref:RING-type domain-containing protein n=1 Tax=Tetracentron sinense TaxID=13715 RepID=A0A835DDM3_TETSI|nr:hypothetical protein HHK36_015420 [Tetracentron sinense]